ncbi:MAG: hypothetical protein G3M78_14355 [Candidatus Nitrohelix vancouverensis]|uniref:PpiC domain-containing protein n=1 Tax=Candidatus Nitrohelix vancouverensis TaxID=2705534 RepID=A0A7T0C4R9_9BACT|nr:MAG: hypothetical protein G3M78_14355 [Candidatus Nitrohelix vancouverensis]
MKHLVAVLTVCTAIWTQTALADPGDGLVGEAKIPDIVASVNGVDIDSRYVKFQLERIIKMNKRPLTAKEQTVILKDIVDKEIARELVLLESKKEQKKLPPELLEEQFAALKKSYKSEDDFQKALKERGFSEADLRHAMEIDSLAQMLLGEYIKGRVEIDDDDVKKFYEDNKERFLRPVSRRVSHIFIAPFPPGYLDSTPLADRETTKLELARKADAKIRDILKEVRDGADFAEMAKKHSDDTASSENGGDLGYVYKGVLPEEFDEALEKLQPGEISEPFITPYGHHIAKLIENRPSEYAPFKDMEESIQRHLFTEKAQDEINKYVDSLKEKADIKIFF